MTTVAVASAKGSPGATIAALALATQWPRPVALADVDPAGGDVVWRVRGLDGGPLDLDRGMLSLGAGLRRGVSETTLAEHLQDTAFGFPVLTGVPTPEQLAGIGGAWTHLGEVFNRHEADVIVDCGRISLSSPSLPVLHKADVVLLVVRPDLEGTAHLRHLLRALQGTLRLGQAGAPQVCVVAVTSYRDTRVTDDLQRLLDHEGLAARVAGVVAHDEKGARMLSSTLAGNLARSLLVRSARDLAKHLTDLSRHQTGRS
ncbi:hypothetical protein [Nocardioides sp.]|uniref:hypothetical protein n=1 Tax=Nocardioides sp. TaxID=35761 RepID=UPI00271F1B22|nr:hypothetical protein [Nocardioides sp.]MDO9454777.1 hypothetical protein [Nocardioides sp.]